MKFKNNFISLKSIYDHKNNIFTILSITMSILIIYYHAYPLFYGRNSIERDFISKIFIGENLGSIVVAMFFVISGFMITTSIKNSKNIWIYLLKSIKKIFPPLFLCLIITALVIAPIVSPLSYLNFIKNPSIWSKYVTDNLLFSKETIYNIAGVFTNVPYVNSINGSIWTLKYQFLMYILIIPIFILFLKNSKEKIYKYLFLILLIITIFSFTGSIDPLITKCNNLLFRFKFYFDVKWIIRLSYYFFAGVFINVYSDKISCNKLFITLMIIILLLTFRTEYFPYTCLILLPYFTILIGSIKTNIKYKIPDLSYHIYIWAFPIQQLLMFYLNGKINIYIYIVLSILFTIIISYISYYVSEYPFKKKRGK